MVQNKTEKVQSEITEKIQINKRETELELDNIVQKLEHKVEESFKALSERVVSFMVNSMVEIYEQLDRKNADKVLYSILSKESVECFNIKLHPITSNIQTTYSMVEIYEKLDRKNADKVYSILSKESVDCFNIQLHPISPPLAPSASVETSVTQTDSQNPITEKVAAPRHRKFQNGSKK